MAKLAEQAEHYKEMVEYMEKVVGAVGVGEELTVEERNLLSITYKNVIVALHVSWQIVSFIKQKEGRRNHNHVVAIRDYRARIESKLDSIYGGILSLLDAHLILVAATIDSKVFYLKMKGLVMALIGSLLSILVAIVMPALCFLKIFKNKAKPLQIVLGTTIAALGIISAALGTYSSISRIASSY